VVVKDNWDDEDEDDAGTGSGSGKADTAQGEVDSLAEQLEEKAKVS